MTDLSRRRLFGLLAGAAAAPYLAPAMVMKSRSLGITTLQTAEPITITASGVGYTRVPLVSLRAYEAAFDSFDGLPPIAKGAP